MNRRIELVKRKRDAQAAQAKLVQEQTDSNLKLKQAVEGLYEAINGQEQYDFDKLYDQLLQIDKRLDLAPLFKSLEKSIKDTSHPPSKKTKIDGFSELLKAVKQNKPLPANIKLDKLEKAVVNIARQIEENSKPSDQGAEDYQPVRRVVKVGNRFMFDDSYGSPAAGGGGSDTTSVSNFPSEYPLPASQVTTLTPLAQPSTPTITSVADTNTSTSIIASNTDRKEIEITNTSSAILYLLKGSGTASATNFTARLEQYGYYQTDYTGAIQGVWASDPGDGSAIITESE